MPAADANERLPRPPQHPLPCRRTAGHARAQHVLASPGCSSALPACVAGASGAAAVHAGVSLAAGRFCAGPLCSKRSAASAASCIRSLRNSAKKTADAWLGRRQLLRLIVAPGCTGSRAAPAWQYWIDSLRPSTRPGRRGSLARCNKHIRCSSIQQRRQPKATAAGPGSLSSRREPAAAPSRHGESCCSSTARTRTQQPQTT